MTSGLPMALIVGGSHLVAKLLLEELKAKDIRVELVDEEGLETDEKVAYVFDFEGQIKFWKKAAKDGAKLAVIAIDKEGIKGVESLDSLEVDWRVVETREVYGVGMEVDSNWLGRCLESAVLNRELVVPKIKKVRPVAGADVVEAILRATFLSDTRGKKYYFGGAGVETKEVIDWIEKEAKMTKEGREEFGQEVVVKEDREVEENWQMMRWTPVIEWRVGLVEVMQYFFTLADEFGRKRTGLGKKVGPSYMETYEEELGPSERMEMEVVVEPSYADAPTLEATEAQRATEGKSAEEDVKEIDIEEYLEEVEEMELERPAAAKALAGKEEVKEIIEKIEPVIAEVPKKKVSKPKWQKVKLVALGGVFMMLLVIGFVGWWGLRLYGVVRGLEVVAEEVKRMEWKKVEVEVKKQSENINGVKSDWISLGMGQWKWGEEVVNALRLADQGLVVIDRAVPLMEKSTLLYGVVFKDKETDVAKMVAESEPMVVELTTELGELEARMKGNWTYLPSIYRQKIKEGVDKVETYRKMMGVAGKILPVLPEMVGVNGKKKEWLVLFQNENELRPSGGFIGSFGILSFEDGKFLNLEVRDVYSADGQLKGHVEPPKPIKDHLGEAGWFMRDSNWQASFPSAVKDILWFFEKETGRKVDGVIGIDLAVAKGMLAVVGEVYLPDFKEKVNKDNLYEQAQFYSESKFFPGSREKENFLGSLAKQLFEEMKNLPLEKQGKMVEELIDLADRNELQMVANEPNLGKVLTNLGWDGAMYGGGCAKTNCVADYLYIVEANLGVNKVNYFINRGIEQMVEITDNAVARVVKINLENTAKSNNWPGGDYKNFVRIYLPWEVNISSVEVYANSNVAAKTVLSGDKLGITKVMGKKEVSFLVTVPINSQRTVEIRYSSSITLGKEATFSYLGYIQKQPGYGNTGLVSLVSFPSGWQPMQVQPAASMVGNKLLFNQKLDRDIRMGVEIGK